MCVLKSIYFVYLCILCVQATNTRDKSNEQWKKEELKRLDLPKILNTTFEDIQVIDRQVEDDGTIYRIRGKDNKQYRIKIRKKLLHMTTQGSNEKKTEEPISDITENRRSLETTTIDNIQQEITEANHGYYNDVVKQHDALHSFDKQNKPSKLCAALSLSFKDLQIIVGRLFGLDINIASDYELLIGYYHKLILMLKEESKLTDLFSAIINIVKRSSNKINLNEMFNPEMCQNTCGLISLVGNSLKQKLTKMFSRGHKVGKGLSNPKNYNINDKINGYKKKILTFIQPKQSSASDEITFGKLLPESDQIKISQGNDGLLLYNPGLNDISGINNEELKENENNLITIDKNEVTTENLNFFTNFSSIFSGNSDNFHDNNTKVVFNSVLQNIKMTSTHVPFDSVSSTQNPKTQLNIDLPIYKTFFNNIFDKSTKNTTVSGERSDEEKNYFNEAVVDFKKKPVATLHKLQDSSPSDISTVNNNNEDVNRNGNSAILLLDSTTENYSTIKPADVSENIDDYIKFPETVVMSTEYYPIDYTNKYENKPLDIVNLLRSVDNDFNGIYDTGDDINYSQTESAKTVTQVYLLEKTTESNNKVFEDKEIHKENNKSIEFNAKYSMKAKNKSTGNILTTPTPKEENFEENTTTQKVLSNIQYFNLESNLVNKPYKQKNKFPETAITSTAYHQQKNKFPETVVTSTGYHPIDFTDEYKNKPRDSLSLLRSIDNSFSGINYYNIGNNINDSKTESPETVTLVYSPEESTDPNIVFNKVNNEIHNENNKPFEINAKYLMKEKNKSTGNTLSTPTQKIKFPETVVTSTEYDPIDYTDEYKNKKQDSASLLRSINGFSGINYNIGSNINGRVTVTQVYPLEESTDSNIVFYKVNNEMFENKKSHRENNKPFEINEKFSMKAKNKGTSNTLTTPLPKEDNFVESITTQKVLNNIQHFNLEGNFVNNPYKHKNISKSFNLDNTVGKINGIIPEFMQSVQENDIENNKKENDTNILLHPFSENLRAENSSLDIGNHFHIANKINKRIPKVSTTDDLNKNYSFKMITNNLKNNSDFLETVKPSLQGLSAITTEKRHSHHDWPTKHVNNETPKDRLKDINLNLKMHIKNPLELSVVTRTNTLQDVVVATEKDSALNSEQRRGFNEIINVSSFEFPKVDTSEQNRREIPRASQTPSDESTIEEKFIYEPISSNSNSESMEFTVPFHDSKAKTHTNKQIVYQYNKMKPNMMSRSNYESQDGHKTISSATDFIYPRGWFADLKKGKLKTDAINNDDKVIKLTYKHKLEPSNVNKGNIDVNFEDESTDYNNPQINNEFTQLNEENPPLAIINKYKLNDDGVKNIYKDKKLAVDLKTNLNKNKEIVSGNDYVSLGRYPVVQTHKKQHEFENKPGWERQTNSREIIAFIGGMKPKDTIAAKYDTFKMNKEQYKNVVSNYKGNIKVLYRAASDGVDGPIADKSSEVIQYITKGTRGLATIEEPMQSYKKRYYRAYLIRVLKSIIREEERKKYLCILRSKGLQYILKMLHGKFRPNIQPKLLNHNINNNNRKLFHIKKYLKTVTK